MASIQVLSDIDIAPAAILITTLVWLLYSKFVGNSRLQDRPRRVSSKFPWLGQDYEFSMDPLGFIVEQKDALGDCFSVRLHGKDAVFLTSSVLISQILEKTRDFEQRPEKTSIVHDALPIPKELLQSGFSIGQDVHGVFQSGGTISTTDYMAALHKQLLVELLRMKEQVINNAHDNFPLWQFIFCSAYIAQVSSRHACHTPRTPSPRIFDDRAMFEKAFSSVTSTLPVTLRWQSAGTWSRFGVVFRNLLGFSWSKSTKAHLALCAKEVASVFERHGIDDEYLSHSLLEFLWGPHSRSAWIIFWFLAHLIQDPEQLNLVKTEVDCFINSHGGQLNKIDFTLKDTALLDQANLPALEAGFRETIRLSTSFTFSRYSSVRAVLYPPNQFPLRMFRNQNVIAFPRFVHMDPENYDEPERFNLKNFLSDSGKTLRTLSRNGNKPIDSVFFPWGNNTTCKEKFLSSNEFKLFVIMILRLFDISPRGVCARSQRSILNPDISIPRQIFSDFGILCTQDDLLVNLVPRYVLLHILPYQVSSNLLTLLTLDPTNEYARDNVAP